MTRLTLKKQGCQSRAPGSRHPEVMQLGFVCVLLSLLAGEAPVSLLPILSLLCGPSSLCSLPFAPSAFCSCPQHLSPALPPCSAFTPLPPTCPQGTAGQTPEPSELRNATPTLSPGRLASSTSPTSSVGPPSSVTAGCSQLPTAASRECPLCGGGWE